MITVVLVEPSKSGNLGAVCRSMKNFGLNELVLVNPKCNKNSLEARKRAKHARDVLKKAKVVKQFSYIDKFDYKVGTTSKIGKDYNITRVPVTASVFSNKFGKSKKKVALVFGREGKGLYNSELEKCDFVVAIPTSKKYPTINLAHSCTVLFYELFLASGMDSISSHIAEAGGAEFKQIMRLLDTSMKKMKFQNKDKKETQRKVWRRMITKSNMSKREAYALMGFLRKLM